MYIFEIVKCVAYVTLDADTTFLKEENIDSKFIALKCLIEHIFEMIWRIDKTMKCNFHNFGGK